MKKWLVVSCIVISMLTVISCGNILNTSTTKGSLAINIEEAMSRTLLPNISMDISYYIVAGSGPSNSSFSDTITVAGTITKTNLFVGTWTITVDAYNASNEKIGSASQTATVTPNATSQVSMIVIPLIGNGSFQYTLTWPSDAGISAPSVVGEIYQLNQDPISVVFTINGDSASYSTDLPAGYYAFGLALLDGTETVWSSNPIAFRIVTGATTSGQTELNGDELAMYGNLDINVGVDLKNPITIGLNGSATSITTNESLTVAANISGTPDIIEWFLDGQYISSLNDQTSATINAGLGVGRHCLSIIVLESTIIGSEDFWFDVTLPDQSSGIAEDFEDGQAQGWNLGGNWSIENGVLNSIPTATTNWKAGYYSSSTFGGAMEYKATINASDAVYPFYSKGIAIGSTNPVTNGMTDGVYFTIAGNASNYYDFWVGKGNGSGDVEWWTGWTDYSYTPTTVTLKIITDGAGVFYFYINDYLVYSFTDTSIGAGYVGVFYFDGDDGYGNGNVFNIDNVYLTYEPVTTIYPVAAYFKQPMAVKMKADLTKHLR